MPRIPLPEPGTAYGDVLRALNSPVGHMGVFRALAHASTNVLPVMRLGRSILADQALNSRLRELLILLAMKLEGGNYEWIQHVDIALGVGATNAEIDAISELRTSDHIFSRQDRAVLEFGRAVVEGGHVSAEIFDAVCEVLSHREIVEAIIAIGYYMMLARVTEVLQIEPDHVQGMAVFRVSQRSAPLKDL